MASLQIRRNVHKLERHIVSGIVDVEMARLYFSAPENILSAYNLFRLLRTAKPSGFPGATRCDGATLIRRLNKKSCTNIMRSS